MTDRLHLALVIHNHQPVGNFDHVFEEAYDRAYTPMIDWLERRPDVRLTMHYTGSLRDWLLHHRPDFLPRVRALVARGQVEILGGAYYEPILVMLDDQDKVGQMERLNGAAEADFGVRPTGMWLAERVWEPGLPRPIARAGLRYAVVDDTHFHFAGFRDEQLRGYYLTEDQSYKVALFPTDKNLRFGIPGWDVDALMRYLRRIYESESRPANPMMVMGDDGEKFGLWVGSHARCWDQGWMDALADAVRDAGDWLTWGTPGDYMTSHSALGRAYIPTASYVEMSEWALPPDQSAEFRRLRQAVDGDDARDQADGIDLDALRHYLRGGFWRNFLVKYPEANHMQKRAVYTSRRAHAYLTGAAQERALEHIWAAQCNCAYWHGVFGGVYLYHIRAANYANLLEAEAAMCGDRVHLEQTDFDVDGQDEVMVNAHPVSLVIAPGEGGAIFEWDDLPSRFNLLNIMSRRQEGYHERLVDADSKDRVITPDMPAWTSPPAGSERARESGLAARLTYDSYRRGLLIDHFIPSGTPSDALHDGTYHESGDFVAKPYSVTVQGDGTTEATVTLTRDGTVDGQAVTVSKTITVRHGERALTVDYTVSNRGDSAVQTVYTLEGSLGFDGGDGLLCAFVIGDTVDGNLGKAATHNGVQAYRLETHIRGFAVDVTLSQPCTLWRYPLEPITMSDAGFERIHQGAAFMHGFRLNLSPGNDWNLRLHYALTDLKS